MNIRNKLALSAAAFLMTVSSASAGVVFQVETTYHSGSSDVESSEMSVEKPNLKMEIKSGQNGSDREEVIFRGEGDGKMIVINHEEQYYMAIDPATVSKLGTQVSGQMDQAMNELNKHLEGLDPKQREMMEQMLKGGLGDLGDIGGAMPQPPKRAKSEFRKTGERATKNGYPCVKYEVLRGGEKVQELWVTDWSNVKGSKEAKDAFEELEEFLEEMTEAVGESFLGTANGSVNGLIGTSDGSVNTFSKVDGFPVVTREFEGGELESETVLKSVTERDFDPDAFEPPKGYRLRTMGPQ